MGMPDGFESHMTRLESTLGRLGALAICSARRQQRLDSALAELADSHNKLVETQKRADEALGALIHTMDEWRGRNPSREA